MDIEKKNPVEDPIPYTGGYGCMPIIIILGAILMVWVISGAFTSDSDDYDSDYDTYETDSDDFDSDGDVDYDDAEKHLYDSLIEDENDGDDW